MLKKFCITDNHKKFSLYEEYGSDSKYYKRVTVSLNVFFFPQGRRLFDEDHPLEVVLEASVFGHNSKLTLRDNLCSTIQWDAFTLPELQNFITILQREESIYASRVSLLFYYKYRE